MTPEQFVYWLQGYMEITNPDNLALEQIQIIRDHLNLVFDKETPDRTQETVENVKKNLLDDPNFEWPKTYCSNKLDWDHLGRTRFC